MLSYTYDDLRKRCKNRRNSSRFSDQAEEYRMAMIEAIAETDEELMEKYLEGEEITEEELHAALRKATIANEMFHVSVVLHTKTKVFKK